MKRDVKKLIDEEKLESESYSVFLKKLILNWKGEYDNKAYLEMKKLENNI